MFSDQIMCACQLTNQVLVSGSIRENVAAFLRLMPSTHAPAAAAARARPAASRLLRLRRHRWDTASGDESQVDGGAQRNESHLMRMASASIPQQKLPNMRQV